MDEVKRILDYVRLRQDFYAQLKKGARKSETPFIEARLRELLTLQLYLDAMIDGNQARVLAKEKAIRDFLVPQPTLDI